MRFGEGVADPYAGTGGTTPYTGPGSPNYDYATSNIGAQIVDQAVGASVPIDYTRPADSPTSPAAPGSMPSWVKPVGIALAAVAALYWVTK